MYWKCNCGEWLSVDDDIPHNNSKVCSNCGKVFYALNHCWEVTHCWNPGCHGQLIVRYGWQDGEYGHACPACNNTLRKHPLFGEGMKFDKEDPEKWLEWLALSDLDKNKIRGEAELCQTSNHI